MATSTNTRATSRAASTARNQILDELKEDHKRVKKASREFEKLDAEQSPEECEALVQQVLQELQVHTALEEELLYPAAREAIEEDLVDEAEVEHESAHTLIDQLLGMSAGDEKYSARFTVLCEYVLHHVKEEETEMFPQLEKAKGIDWESLAQEMSTRRSELMGAVEDEEEEEPAAAKSMDVGEGEEMADNGVVPGRGATSRKI